MKKVAVDSVPNAVQSAAVMRRLTDALETTDLAINYYELEPGDSFSFAYHSHELQEEVFYVQEGTATFETESGPVTVEASEVIRFPPGELQRGWNRGDERVVALALGAPLAYGEVLRLRDCPSCAEMTDNDLNRRGDDSEKEVVVAHCKTCGTETGRWVDGSMPGTVP